MFIFRRATISGVMTRLFCLGGAVALPVAIAVAEGVEEAVVAAAGGAGDFLPELLEALLADGRRFAGD